MRCRKRQDQAIGRADIDVHLKAANRLLTSVPKRKARAGEGKALEAFDTLVKQREVEVHAFD